MNVLFVTEIDQREQRLLYGVVICVCAIMFSVVVAAVALIIYAKPGGSPLACVTEECLAARVYLAGLLNGQRGRVQRLLRLRLRLVDRSRQERR
ncbi:hypothetical protein MRX96_043288 [Rhipicephalus microplus]